MLILAISLGASLSWRGFIYDPLHIDEHVSFWVADRSSPSTLVVRSFHYSATPPFSFLLQRLSLDLFGRREWALRLPAAACYLGSIFTIWWLGRQWLTPLAGGLAAVLLATHPLVAQLATAGRPYGVGMLLGLHALNLTVRVREQPERRLFLVLWASVNLALIQTHYLFCALWAVELAWLVWPSANRPFSGRLLVECMIVLTACAFSAMPGLLRIWEHREGLNWTTRQLGPADIAWLILPVEPPLAHSALAWLGLAAPFVWLAISKRTPVRWLDAHRYAHVKRFLGRVLLYFLIPVIGHWLVGRFWLASLSAERYLMIYVPAAALVLSSFASVLSGKLAPMLALAALVTLQGAGPRLIRNQTRMPDATSVGWQRAAGTNTNPDLTLVASGLTEMILVPPYRDDPVFHDYVSCRLGRMYVQSHRHERLSLPMIWTHEMPGFYRSVVSRVRSELRSGDPLRVWLVYGTDTDLLRASGGHAEALLREMGGQETLRRQYEGVECVLFQVP